MAEEQSVVSDATRRLLELKKKILMGSKDAKTPSKDTPLETPKETPEESPKDTTTSQYMRSTTPRPLTKTASPLAQTVVETTRGDKKPALTLKSLMGTRLRKSQEFKEVLPVAAPRQLPVREQPVAPVSRLKQAPAHRTKEPEAVPKLIRLTKPEGSESPQKQPPVSMRPVGETLLIPAPMPKPTVEEPHVAPKGILDESHVVHKRTLEEPRVVKRLVEPSLTKKTKVSEVIAQFEVNPPKSLRSSFLNEKQRWLHEHFPNIQRTEIMEESVSDFIIRYRNLLS